MTGSPSLTRPTSSAERKEAAMNARHLLIAVALPVVALTAGVLAAVPGQQHHEQPLYGQQADAGPLLSALQHLGGSHGHRASAHHLKHGHNSLQNGQSGINQSITGLSTFANVDFAAGGYGQYDPAALHDSWVQSVIINLDWSQVERSPGSFDWAPLDQTATTWANAGKHVVLVVRAANEIGGGCSATGWGQILPGWEINALHNALGRTGTFCDKGVNSLVPDWFSGTFQSDFLAFVRALGAHVTAQPYYDSISYVRIGVGLGGEAFFLFPQNGYSADKSWMETNWGYSPQAWENFQETMLGAYDAAFPAPVQVIYPINAQDTAPDGNPVDYNVARWAITNFSNIGIGAECLEPSGIGQYGDFGPIVTLLRDSHPNAYIQFQTCGVTTSASEEQGIINAAEGYGAKSIEWYESTIVSPPSVPDMTAYQTWANNTFRS
jgi:hypothetical protein